MNLETESRTLPVIALRNVVFFPSMVAPIVVGRKKSKEAVEKALQSQARQVLAVLQKEPEKDEPLESDLYTVGTTCRIIKMARSPDGSLQLLLQGIARAKILHFIRTDPYFEAEFLKIEEVPPGEISPDVEALIRAVKKNFEEYVKISQGLPPEAIVVAQGLENPGKLADFIAGNLPVSLKEKQSILETFDTIERVKKAFQLLSRELEMARMIQKIQQEARSQMDKAQREYFLRQQLEAIKKELGESDERAMEIKELEEKIKAAKMPPEVEKEAMRELKRLSMMPPAAAEYNVSRTYLDWLISLPWSKATKDNKDINRAKKILDEDHYNLEKVKERILEFLAVRTLKKDTKGPILCFVGPPGVGKTSLGKSIARALGRKFVRISLGGIRDEAEIRGHRRTYVGALPGRIIQGIRRAGTKNPVFMLDEIDKIGADFRGDPAAALLEVLDPEQNYAFVDHYLDVPFDLSQVLFIATANVLHTIPPALLDRMEVLELPGYTDYEKLQIAKKYLIPKQLEETGLKEQKIEVMFTKKAILKIIHNYTREAGLRNLERSINKILRRIALEVSSKKKKRRYVINEKNLKKYLGPETFTTEEALRKPQVGVATGLAWTPTGGEIIFVESTKMPGDGKLILTGQLGDVMKESAQAALSFVKSNYYKWKIEASDFKKFDVHIHVPAGAIPKDGPSAGVTMAVSLVSLFSGSPVNPDVAMTGEITLRGRVLPVGGIREKVLAAKRAGIKTVLLPRQNEKNLEEIPKEHLKGLEFIFVETIEEAVSKALVK